MIYLCIPAHNEEQTVGVVLWKIRQVLTDFPRDYQILVADDASTDRTADVLAPYARVLPLTVLRARERRGYAASLEMLLREAVRRSPYPRRDAIVTLQADFTDEPEDIVPLIKKIEQGADIVGGERASDRRPEMLERWLVRWQHRLLRRTAWPDQAGDPLSGFRVYRVSTIQRALEEVGEKRLLAWDGAIADAELLRAAAPHARRIESVDLVFRPDRRQRPTRASTWERLKRLRRFVRGATPVGTVPLADLSPETLPPPRPLEIERERRSNVATAEPQRGRNGRPLRNGGRRPARPDRSGGSGKPARSGESTRAERKPAESGPQERPARPRRTRGETRDVAPAAAPTAQGTLEQGNQAADGTAAEGAVRKKRRRRRRRKSGAAGGENQAAQQSQPESAGGDGSPPEAPQGSSDIRPEMGTGALSTGSTESSESGEGAPKKRRRRGGRRGGRGRRRKPAGGTGSAESAPESQTAADTERVRPPASAESAEHASVGGDEND